MARLHLVEGPVGAGKSTFAGQLSTQFAGPRFLLDDWMATLCRAEGASRSIEQYFERKDLCIEQIWKVASEVARFNNHVVMELGLIRQVDRQSFYDRLDGSGFELTMYVLEASRATRKARVQERNLTQGSTFSMLVTDEVFAQANNFWESPDDEECAEHDIRFHSTEPTSE